MRVCVCEHMSVLSEKTGSMGLDRNQSADGTMIGREAVYLMRGLKTFHRTLMKLVGWTM